MSLFTQNHFCDHEAKIIRGTSENNKIVRKVINSAVYVEKILPDMYYKSTRPTTIKKTVKCCCSSNFSKCPVHVNDYFEFDARKSSELVSGSESTLSGTSFDLGSQVTVREVNGLQDSDLKLQLSSRTALTTHRNYFDNAEKEEILKNWLERKEKEKKERVLREQKKQEEKKRQREELLEKERENFRRWLTEKKKEELIRRKEKERELDEEQQKEMEKVRRQKENEFNYKLWLKRKRKDELERKIQEKIRENEELEERERRIEANRIAFEDWLKNSRNKPKPIPLNQGLTSLCSSLSVTYINPVPWTPNIKEI